MSSKDIVDVVDAAAVQHGPPDNNNEYIKRCAIYYWPRFDHSQERDRLAYEFLASALKYGFMDDVKDVVRLMLFTQQPRFNETVLEQPAKHDAIGLPLKIGRYGVELHRKTHVLTFANLGEEPAPFGRGSSRTISVSYTILVRLGDGTLKEFIVDESKRYVYSICHKDVQSALDVRTVGKCRPGYSCIARYVVETKGDKLGIWVKGIDTCSDFKDMMTETRRFYEVLSKLKAAVVGKRAMRSNEPATVHQIRRLVTGGENVMAVFTGNEAAVELEQFGEQVLQVLSAAHRSQVFILVTNIAVCYFSRLWNTASAFGISNAALTMTLIHGSIQDPGNTSLFFGSEMNESMAKLHNRVFGDDERMIEYCSTKFNVTHAIMYSSGGDFEKFPWSLRKFGERCHFLQLSEATEAENEPTVEYVDEDSDF